MVASVRIAVLNQQVVHKSPGQHPLMFAILALIELEDGSPGVVDQGVVTGDQHAELEPQALGLGQDVEQELVVVQRLLGGCERVSMRLEILRGQSHLSGDSLSIRGVCLHEGLKTALAEIEWGKDQPAALLSAQDRQPLRLKRISAHRVVDPMPFQCANRDVDNRAGLPSGHDLSRP